FSGALAGGPIKGGRVAGASDSKGAFPAREPHSPLDVLRMMYDHLGVDATVSYTDYTGRPHPVLAGGKVIEGLV
ncbi:MAG: DUF1501 domain-containing protein, partial [Planctomycetaceae bacterium]|nr:DUF1501 domain-containing protein [Planctomycetaceae bacterium]